MKSALDIPTPVRSFTKYVTARSSDDASGDVAYTGVGFQPSNLIVLMFDEDLTKGISIGIGSVANQACQYNTSDATPSVGVTNGSILMWYNPDAATAQSAVIKSFDADGFTLTYTKTGAPAHKHLFIYFLCLR